MWLVVLGQVSNGCCSASKTSKTRLSSWQANQGGTGLVSHTMGGCLAKEPRAVPCLLAELRLFAHQVGFTTWLPVVCGSFHLWMFSSMNGIRKTHLAHGWLQIKQHEVGPEWAEGSPWAQTLQGVAGRPSLHDVHLVDPLSRHMKLPPC